MAEPPRIRIRCSEQVKKKWKEACGAFDLTYAELALNAAKFVLENRDDFERFLYRQERSRETRR